MYAADSTKYQSPVSCLIYCLQELIPHRYTTDDETGLETDQESYIRTDDEEGGQSEWEEAMKRWVNR